MYCFLKPFVYTFLGFFIAFFSSCFNSQPQESEKRWGLPIFFVSNKANTRKRTSAVRKYINPKLWNLKKIWAGSSQLNLETQLATEGIDLLIGYIDKIDKIAEKDKSFPLKHIPTEVRKLFGLVENETEENPTQKDTEVKMPSFETIFKKLLSVFPKLGTKKPKSLKNFFYGEKHTKERLSYYFVQLLESDTLQSIESILRKLTTVLQKHSFLKIKEDLQSDIQGAKKETILEIASLYSLLDDDNVSGEDMFYKGNKPGIKSLTVILKDAPKLRSRLVNLLDDVLTVIIPEITVIGSDKALKAHLNKTASFLNEAIYDLEKEIRKVQSRIKAHRNQPKLLFQDLEDVTKVYEKWVKRHDLVEKLGMCKR